MANNLFSLKDVKNHPSRSGFDLSSKLVFSAKAGEILPVYWTKIFPGDKFSISNQWFTRTAPVETAAYTRFREYYDWFYVPMHILWKSFDTVITQMTDNPVQATSISGNAVLSNDMPYLNLSYSSTTDGAYPRSLMGAIQFLKIANKKNQFGFARWDLAYKLMQYLRYGPMVSPSDSNSYGTSVPESVTFSQKYKYNLLVDIFPLAAYHKFYQDYFRRQQWEKAKPYLWNFDYSAGGSLVFNFNSSNSYWDSDTLVDLHYANWKKDLFMGILPNSQFGDVSVISSSSSSSAFKDVEVINGISSITSLGSAVLGGNINQISGVSGSNPNLSNEAQGSGFSNYIGSAIKGKNMTVSPTVGVNRLGFDTSQFVQSFNVLQLRQAEALQRWKEVTLAGSQDYRSQIEQHFGVKVPAILSNMSTFVGGSVGTIEISEVVNQNLDSDSSEASIKGKGVGSGNDQVTKSYDFNDYGILMCLYHVEPLLDYEISGQDPQLLWTHATDYPLPEFDRIGFEGLPLVTLLNSSLLNVNGWNYNSILGYTVRNSAIKTSVDRIVGAMTTTLKSWVAPVGSSYFADWLQYVGATSGQWTSINYQFFKINPRLLDPIFGVAADSTWDTDQFYVNAYFDVKAVRNFDYDGMPY